MLGTLRLTLALAVLISHVGVTIASLNPGVISVVVFYAISGYVMNQLIHAYYGSLGLMVQFYMDRMLRILPQYIFYLGGAYLWYYLTQTVTIFTQRAPTVIDVFNNLTIVPLNFFMYNQSDHFALIPPAWSLGAELQFYLIVPLLVISRSLFWVLVCLSLTVQALALTGFLHSDWWGYRLLPGVLWIFALGIILSQRHIADNEQRAFLGRVVGLLLVLFALVAAILTYYERLTEPYYREVIIGAAFAVCLIATLGTMKVDNPLLKRLDTWMGHVSYGVFLNHFLILWLFGWQGRSLTGKECWILSMVSLIASAVSFILIEAPILRWRRHWRSRINTST